ncbi:hypothetical protein [Phenylobacterium sp.]|uniref:hypothetical protein n=1 Tax=Phenylobacterium sp. TaxID=1871053 RepID=UPI0035B28C67
MKWITIEQLDIWAQTLQARADLPELVADLIRASAPAISDIRFPSGGKGQVRGFDGWLEAVGVPPHVPDGRSVWEFGVSGATGTKLTADYDKRTTEVPAEDRKDLTLVLVTPFTWDDPKVKVVDWVDAKRARKDWKDVRLLEGPHLIHWLEDRPSVAARWARKIGARPADVRSTDQYWDEYVLRFQEPLSEDILLCGREKSAEVVIDRFMGGSGAVSFVADSPEEVVAFAVAAIRKAEPAKRYYLEARTLIVDTEAAGRALWDEQQGVFLPRGQAMSTIPMLASRGPTLKAGSFDRPNQDAEILERPSAHVLADAFEKMGLEPDKAARVARDCGRSITVLERTFPGEGHVEPPRWRDEGTKLLAPLLAIGWDARHDNDRAILAALGNRAYEDIESDLRPLLRTEDPPLEQNGSVWRLRAPVDAFVHIAHRLGSVDLDRFRAAAIKVLSVVEADPKPGDYRRLDEERQETYSEWLRNGLSTTILQIAVLSKPAGLSLNGVPPQDWVNDLVQALNLDQGHRLLASLRNQLTYLMEAAPVPLLGALERLLEGDKIAPLFEEVEGPLSPSSRHTGLLWALEMLAWDPAYLVRVCDILARLALVDPGGRLTNRPTNSLREILVPWSPNTYASDALRHAALETVERRSADLSWSVSLALLPRDHDVSTPTPKPRFREAGQEQAVTPTYESLSVFYTELARRVLRLAQGHARRTAELVPHLERFGGAPWDEAIAQINDFMAHTPAEERREVWDALVELRDRHRRFASAEWAMKVEHLAQIEALVDAYMPADATARFGDLFDDWFPSIGGAADPDEAAILEARRAAVREILVQPNAAEHLVDLAARSKLPWSVGQAAAYEIDDLDVLAQLLSVALRDPTTERVGFAASASSTARKRHPDAWAARLKKLIEDVTLSPERSAQLILSWPEADDTWDFVESLGPEVDRQFWTRKRAFRLDPGGADLFRTVRKYVEVGRPGAALDAAGGRLQELTPAIVLRLLDAHIDEIVSGGGDGADAPMAHYRLEQIFGFLDGIGELSLEEVAARELRIFPLLSHAKRPLALHALMAKSGAFYAEVLALVYPPKAKSDTGEAETGERQARAKAGFRLLYDFKRSPGISSDPPMMDKDEVLTWVADVRAANTEAERAALYDVYIGRALAHAPLDPDGAWPHRALRDALEVLAAHDIERGVATERFNMRGVFMKAMYEGGSQERKLAADYREWRDRAVAWPRTAALLEDIASRWDANAEDADLRARQDLMRD